MQQSTESAEDRFRAAFERLKAGKPLVMPGGTVVSQNNVAKEAGRDPTALRLTRYPVLVREIKTWVEIQDKEKLVQKAQRDRRRHVREEATERVKIVEGQRDSAQSQLASAHRRILELLQENAELKRRLDDGNPPPERL